TDRAEGDSAQAGSPGSGSGRHGASRYGIGSTEYGPSRQAAHGRRTADGAVAAQRRLSGADAAVRFTQS
ncbi:MAG TPA: hypothetical protein VGB91_04190, partial [Rhizomicrobium sp.]